MSELVYNDAFYRNRNRKSEYAAERILGIVFDELAVKPNSVVDIGCGVGTWLRISKEKYGVKHVLGVDGAYVPQKYLQVSDKEFLAENLEKYEAEKLYQYNQNSQFDLAISLEVAEHIDRKYAKEFVNKLCNLSNVVCFSAAIPKQGGDAHVNEQRLSYWVDLFNQNGYLLADIIRSDIWNDKRIPVWYRNNVVLFYKKDVVDLHTKQAKYICDIVHPEMLEQKVKEYENKILQLQKSRNFKSLTKEKVWKIVNKIKNFQ